MKKQNKKLISQVVEDIKKAAKMADIKPQEVTKFHFMAVSDVTDWQLRTIGGLPSIVKANFPQEDKELATLQTNKSAASYVNKLESELGKKLWLEEEFIDTLKNLKSVTAAPYKSKGKKEIKRAMNLILSDLHIGSDIKKDETGLLDFGRVEEARRLSRIVKEVMDYKKEHRAVTKLNVILLGDLIQGALGHDPRDGAEISVQYARALYLLNQALAQLSSAFPEVEVHCNTGNHGRITSRHPQRAVHGKWDSFETMLAYSLKQIMADAKNVKFNIPLTPFITYEEFGKKYFFTHGDNVLKVGFPGKAIPTGSLENQINKINASLSDKDEYSVIGVGHVHTASITHLANGSVVITNGAMVPADEFAVSIGLMETSCGQYLFESVQDYPVGDCRLIRVDEKDDKDKSLDTIIKPWNGFNDK